MRRALVQTIPARIGSLVEIPEFEARHLTQVLRLGANDEIELLDGNGHRGKATLYPEKRTLFAKTISEPESEESLLSHPIQLYMSILKGEAMEWVIEKAVELGVRNLYPVETEFNVVKIHKRGAESFQERWQRIADQSLKQCGRLDRMVVHMPVTFEDVLAFPKKLYWLDEKAYEKGDPYHLSKVSSHLSQNQECGLFVGPEGGFSASERSRLIHLSSLDQNRLFVSSLGHIILRAETAAIMGVASLVGSLKRS